MLRSLVLGVVLLLGLSAGAAELQVPARQVSVTTNTWEHLTLTPTQLTAQATFEWLDDNWPDLTDYVKTNETDLLTFSNNASRLVIGSLTTRSNVVIGGSAVVSNALTAGSTITFGGETRSTWPSNTFGLQSNTVVTLTPTMSDSERQALINAVPKYLNGYELAIRLNNGSYSIASPITVSDFVGGTLFVESANWDRTNALKITQPVVLTESGDASPALIYVLRCRASCLIGNMRINYSGTVTDTSDHGIVIYESPGPVQVATCYFVDMDGPLGEAVVYNNSSGFVTGNAFAAGGTAILAEYHSSVVGYTNGLSGLSVSAPLRGYYADMGSTVYRCDSNEVGTVHEVSQRGSVLVTQDSAVLP